MSPTLIGESSSRGVLRRTRLPGARSDRLYFAQVREDPLLEIDALQPSAGSTLVVVSSGGCTALSLIARGAGRVVAVDVNTTQNHLLELKAAALRSLDPAEVTAFLGAAPMNSVNRLEGYATARPQLGEEAATYWDANQKMIASGVLNCGVSERFIRVVVAALRVFVHPQSRIDRLLSCETLAEQRKLYDEEWNSWKWRLLLSVLLSRRAFDRAYDPQFFENVQNRNFAMHFRKLIEHALCEIPVATNYFLHQMLCGEYPTDVAGGLPPYLEDPTGPGARHAFEDLELVDGGYAEFLATCDDGSVDCFAMSNICEWLDGAQVREFFSQVVRTARPGARICFRNFVGHTEVPEEFRPVIREDVEAGSAAIRRDRSCLQSRIAICEVEK